MKFGNVKIKLRRHPIAFVFSRVLNSTFLVRSFLWQDRTKNEPRIGSHASNALRAHDSGEALRHVRVVLPWNAKGRLRSKARRIGGSRVRTHRRPVRAAQREQHQKRRRPPRPPPVDTHNMVPAPPTSGYGRPAPLARRHAKRLESGFWQFWQ